MELTLLEQRCLGLSSLGLKDCQVYFSSFHGHAACEYTLQAEEEAWDSLQALCEDAKREGLVIVPCSAFRSFARQAQIVSAKYQGLRPILDANEQPLNPLPPEGTERLRAILRFSALPGCSRHHWGADFDIFAPNLLPEHQDLQLTAHEYEQGSYFYDLGIYLRECLAQFGFIRPYMPDETLPATLVPIEQIVPTESLLSASSSSQSSVPTASTLAPQWRMGVEPWHISYKASAQKWEQAYSSELALSFLEHSDLPFAPYVGELWSQTLVHRLLGLQCNRELRTKTCLS